MIKKLEKDWEQILSGIQTSTPVIDSLKNYSNWKAWEKELKSLKEWVEEVWTIPS